MVDSLVSRRGSGGKDGGFVRVQPVQFAVIVRFAGPHVPVAKTEGHRIVGVPHFSPHPRPRLAQAGAWHADGLVALDGLVDVVSVTADRVTERDRVLQRLAGPLAEGL